MNTAQWFLFTVLCGMSIPLGIPGIFVAASDMHFVFRIIGVVFSLLFFLGGTLGLIAGLVYALHGGQSPRNCAHGRSGGGSRKK